jgi:tetratricopeptide (TPR) repeat protein
MNTENSNKSDLESLSTLLNKRADIYFELKDYKNALKDLFQIISLNGKVNPEICFKIAYCQRNLGNYTEAIENFNIAIKTSHEVQPHYYVERGFAYFMQNEYLSSLKDLKEGLKRILYHPEALRTLALCFERLNDIPEAMENMMIAAEQGDEFALDYVKEIITYYSDEELSELLKKQEIGLN